MDPVVLVALGVLLLNDHMLKEQHGNWWTGKLSDVAGMVLFPVLLVAVFETADLQAYTFLIDSLRDTAFFSQPYFEILDIVPAVEDGYVEYDRAHGVVAA